LGSFYPFLTKNDKFVVVKLKNEQRVS